MLPMALSVVKLLQNDSNRSGAEGQSLHRFSAALVLSIAYGANIGGTATIVGTPPNLAMRGHFSKMLDVEISFLQWMLWALPISMVLLVVVYLSFMIFLWPIRGIDANVANEVFDKEREMLGDRTPAQTRVLIVFTLTALCWIGRDLIVQVFPWLPLSDEMIALVAAIALFVIPAGGQSGRALLSWETTRRLPWGILLLFGGGLALAKGFEQTKVLSTLVDGLVHAGAGNVLLTMILLTAISLYMTEVMSNVALVNVLIPVIIAIAVKMGVAPIEFAFPATLASSCAFMLPIATPPNAIVFSSGYLTIRQMVWIGFWLNLVSLITICALTRWLVG
jgi:solute carrier family 13 (sodium-dependent dicarboxylate transporter), member 2/3/5